MGLEPSARRYYDDGNKNSIDIMNLLDPIDRNIKTYCSIGLSNYNNMIEMNNDNKNIPIELLMAGNKKYENIPNILSTCCFYIIKDKWNCQPGTVFKNIVEMYYKNYDMKHIMFIHPYLWAENLKIIKLKIKTYIFCLVYQYLIMNWILN